MSARAHTHREIETYSVKWYWNLFVDFLISSSDACFHSKSFLSGCLFFNSVGRSLASLCTHTYTATEWEFKPWIASRASYCVTQWVETQFRLTNGMLSRCKSDFIQFSTLVCLFATFCCLQLPLSTLCRRIAFFESARIKKRRNKMPRRKKKNINK